MRGSPCRIYPQPVEVPPPQASGTLGEALRAMLVAGTAASEIVASAAASRFFVFDI
jgi:hypothetical protein